MRPRFVMVFSIAAAVIGLDQLTKLWAVTAIPEHHSVPVIAGLFDLVNVRNRGAAFGFLNRSDIEWQFWLFLVATVLAVWAIISLTRAAQDDKVLFTGFGCILGGALGNLIDRVRFRAVIDFLDFYVGDWHWPAFNVADIAICVGAFLAFIAMYRQPAPRNTTPRSR